jgi:hypothetical protein
MPKMVLPALMQLMSAMALVLCSQYYPMTKKVFWKKYGGKHYFISEATFKV